LRREVARRRVLAEEGAAFRQAGAQLALAADAPAEALGPWQAEVRRAAEALASIAEERRMVAAEEARDLARVAWWVRPAVVLRALASRIVLHHRRHRALRDLDAAHESLGRAGAKGRVGILGCAAPMAGGSAPWTERVGREARGLARALWHQLRGFLMPKAPALAGMAVGWWIANTYTDSRMRSILRTVGIGSGGTHVVSGSTYRAMSFWLPLLAAALCAYIGERLWERVVGREE
jgi:hypothetical protein